MKIVSIGNLSLGGTNKTPLTIHLSNYFLNKGYKIAIISRGYRGEIGSKPIIVSDGNNIFFKPPLSADEPYMMALALKCPVITGKDRRICLKIAEGFYTDIAILDDAFQYKKIKKDVEILLLNYQKPISTGLPFPFGYIREFPWAIKRADIIVFTGCLKNELLTIPHSVFNYVRDKDIFYAKLKPICIENVLTSMNVDDIRNLNVFAFCGIAKPQSFISSIRELNPLKFCVKRFFDHHYYTVKDIECIKKKAKEMNADIIITTEKDYVKLSEDFKPYVYYLKVNIDIEEESKFFSSIIKRLDIKQSRI